MNSLTCILPTYNRSPMVSRLFRYFELTGFKWKILVGDSSTDDETGNYIESEEFSFLVEYIRYPSEIDVRDKVEALIGKVTTPYILPIADDDFFVVETIEKCVRFLNANPDYSVSGGQAILLEVGVDEGLQGGSVEITMSNQFRVPQLRLHQALGNYRAHWYSVHRTEILIDAVKGWERLGDLSDYWVPELLETSIAALSGKTKFFRAPFTFRQIHSERTALVEGNPQNILEWLLAPRARERIELFEKVLTELLEANSCLSVEDSKLWVRHFIWCYIANCFGSAATNPVGALRRRFKAPKLKRLKVRIESLFGILDPETKMTDLTWKWHRYHYVFEEVMAQIDSGRTLENVPD